MLTDEDIKRIADEVVRRSKAGVVKSGSARSTAGRYAFEDGLGDTYDLGDYTTRPAVIDMTSDGCGCFYLILNTYGASHWIGSYGVEKDFEEMVEFISDELTGAFEITQF